MLWTSFKNGSPKNFKPGGPVGDKMQIRIILPTNIAKNNTYLQVTHHNCSKIMQTRMYTLNIDTSDYVYSCSHCPLQTQSSVQSTWDCTHLHCPLQPFSGLQQYLIQQKLLQEGHSSELSTYYFRTSIPNSLVLVDFGL